MIAELLAQTTSRNGLQLLEVRNHNSEWQMRLLPDRLEQSHPLSVIILAGLVGEDDLVLPKSRRRRPRGYGPVLRSGVLEDAVNRVHMNAIHAVEVGQQQFKSGHQSTRRTYDHDGEALLGTSDRALQ